MDRIDAMQAFITALNEGSLAAAGRRLNRSPAAMTRAVATLESHVGVQLLQRTTRSIRLTEAGEQYAVACRRFLNDYEEANLLAAGVRTAPRGLLTITAPIVAGTRILRPILNNFLQSQPAVQARLLLLDRAANLVDEGIDVGLRIAHLPDSNLIAKKVGEVRQVVCAAPGYLAHKPAIKTPSDLVGHEAIVLSQLGREDTWRFAPAEDKGQTHQVRIDLRFSVNTVEAALGAAIDGHGIARVLSYQVEREVRAGQLILLLQDYEPAPLPVHLIAPEGRLAVAKVRAFVDFAMPILKLEFARIAKALQFQHG